MPRRGRNNLDEQRVFFVTTSTINKSHLFDTDEKLRKLLEIIIFNINRNHSVLLGYVLMINHFHLLLFVRDGGKVLSKIMHDIKSYSSRKIFPNKGTVWMSRFDDVAIYTEKQFFRKLNYIHNNPVKVKLVNSQEKYIYSSAKNWINGIEDNVVKFDLSWLSGGDA